jgi:hypothetical protein
MITENIIKPVTIMALVVLVIFFSGAYQNIEIWSWESFSRGFLVMLVVPYIWMRNKFIGYLLGALGLVGLTFIALGFVSDHSIDRVFFSGALSGFLVGIFPVCILNQPKFHKIALFISKVDGYRAATRYFEEKVKNNEKI